MLRQQWRSDRCCWAGGDLVAVNGRHVLLGRLHVADLGVVTELAPSQDRASCGIRICITSMKDQQRGETGAIDTGGLMSYSTILDELLWLHYK